VTSAVASTTWEAAAAARQRTQLAETDARARTAVDELRAAARHLGQLAGAVEELKQDMRAAWSRRHEGLQAELRRATADPLLATGAPELHRHLAQLPSPTDAYWSTQVDVAAVPLPQVAATRSDAPLGPHVPPTVVRVELAELRALAGALRREATTAADTRARAAVAVVLPLSRLDAGGGKVIEHHEEVADWAGDRLQDTGKAMSNLGDGLSDGVGDAWNNVFG